MLQSLDQDALHPTHVDEVDLQGPSACGVEALWGVALPQPQELVALSDPGPGQGSVEEAVGELGHRRPLLGSTALDALRGPEGVGGQLLRVVGGIGGTAAPWLARMELEKPAAVEDAHQLAAQADLHLLPRWAQARRHRVEGVLASHVVIGMNLGGAPIGDLVGLAIPGSQCRTFLFLKDLQRLSSGGAVDPLSGDIPTPAGRLIPEVGQVPELPALEESAP